jgi:hypothetical protein
VRTAQGRDDEAETLFAERSEIVSEGEHCRILLDIVPPYSEFLRGTDARRGDELDAGSLSASRRPRRARS